MIPSAALTLWFSNGITQFCNLRISCQNGKPKTKPSTLPLNCRFRCTGTACMPIQMPKVWTKIQTVFIAIHWVFTGFTNASVFIPLWKVLWNTLRACATTKVSLFQVCLSYIRNHGGCHWCSCRWTKRFVTLSHAACHSFGLKVLTMSSMSPCSGLLLLTDPFCPWVPVLIMMPNLYSAHIYNPGLSHRQRQCGPVGPKMPTCVPQGSVVHKSSLPKKPCTAADQHPFFKTHLVQASENADHHHSTVPITFRRDFESPIAHLRQTDSDAEDERADLPDPDPTGPADALFIRELAANFGDLGINIHDANFNVPLRSWFLDHATIRQWFAPRIFHLQGPPQTWEDQIVAAWRDQLDDDEWFDVSVIQPSPPRPPHHSAVILDVVIAQSIHIHRYAGLVTVIPGSNMRFQMYSVAISFSPPNLWQWHHSSRRCLTHVSFS